ncbi:FecR family protein [Chitinophaga pinensis]|uniref:Anti-FecI sigma factor, FecR n=1 Tax=Chitinophaga pinensis (strain ATCC 43595 / DSM 2588 / LMG 13176 / NBRC 15968 / NCIMB 11800 / UQM 2034) TaxID=485918 RepID=A0A979G7E1_CHIPD|nr:FecR family protein [Chitinophaga pinensis]ACU62097.1 anti-FecI sigma factor, FecR [Chitinophaga pinensis DSM 2588]
MTDQEFNSLLKKYRNGECTPEEQALVESWYLELEGSLPDPGTAACDMVQQRIWERVRETSQVAEIQELEGHKRVTLFRRFGPAVAAACLVAAVATFYFNRHQQKQPAPVAKNVVEDAPAGTNKAILTLANGRRIALDDAADGTLAEESGVTIRKNSKGQLVYTVGDPGLPGGNTPLSPQGGSLPEGERNRVAYNTISTPNGGQYQIYLPDSSMVFLNAASSLKYPVKFNGTERRVELKGEGYFEITKNPDKPFRVYSDKQTIEVLGTHFNVSSYDAEPTTTTLAEGQVKITTFSSSYQSTKLPSGEIASEAAQPRNDGKSFILKPGQQAILSASGRNTNGREGKFQITSVNPEEAIAWKDGLFIFRNTELKDVLRQLARWYDVEVDYNSIPAISIEGELPRNVSLLRVLQLIAASSNVSLKLEGRRIMPK